MGYKGNTGFDKALQGKRKNLLIDDIITKEVLAICLGCCEKTITTYQELGLPYIPLGRDIYFSTLTVYKWLMSRETKNNGNQPEAKKDGMKETSKGGKIRAK